MIQEADKIVDLKRKYMVPCSYHFYKRPPVIVKGEMQFLYGSDGTKYRDFFTGVTVMNCGHCNPEITSDVIQQINTLQHTTTIYLTEPIVRAAEKLEKYIDSSLKKVFFVNSGSEANEGAVLLARIYTGRNGIIALNGGLHGRTALTMSMTGIPMWRTLPEERLEKVHFAPKPHCASCELGRKFPECGLACADAVDELLKENSDIAAMILEPVQGNGGIILPPAGYLERLKEILESHSVLMILDEVQCGMGRTGKKYAFMHSNIEPDIMTTAKALGNGFPIAAFCTTDKIAASYTKPGASTTGGNAMSAIAAVTVLNYHEKHNLHERSAELGEYFISELERLFTDNPYVFEIRGKGLMIGMELKSKSGEPLQEITDSILEEMKDSGFLIGKSGVERNVLTFMPPLIISQQDIDEMIDALKQSFDRIN